MKYFAYGSNMCTGRLQEPERVPSCRKLFIAKLKGHIFLFHKRSITDGSGKGDAYLTNNEIDEVWGVVFYIGDSEKKNLDDVEGLGNGYNEREVEVIDSEGNSHKVWMYYAEKNSIDSSLKPYRWYKRFVVEGGQQHGLPSLYIDRLKNFESIKDSDSNRAAENRAIQC